MFFDGVHSFCLIGHGQNVAALSSVDLEFSKKDKHIASGHNPHYSLWRSVQGYGQNKGRLVDG